LSRDVAEYAALDEYEEVEIKRNENLLNLNSIVSRLIKKGY
jgi:hypothetical protein